MVEYRKKQPKTPERSEAALEDQVKDDVEVVEEAREPLGTVTVRFFAEGTEVEIENFQTMTPGKLQHSFMEVLKEWQRHQQKAVRAQSRKERQNAL